MSKNKLMGVLNRCLVLCPKKAIRIGNRLGGAGLPPMRNPTTNGFDWASRGKGSREIGRNSARKEAIRPPREKGSQEIGHETKP